MFGCKSGSPPVSSTNGIFGFWILEFALEKVLASRWISSRTAISVIFVPSLKAYAESQYEQRRLQAVSRTNMHGNPANVLSPCKLK
jgi:hypothetical protein